MTRRRLLLGTAGVALAASAGAVGVAGAATDPLTTSGSALRFLRHVYSGDPSGPGTERWQYQVIQGDRPRPAADVVGEQMVYATAVRRRSDPDGTTQCLRPADVPTSWLLTDRSGRVITRNDGDDAAIDVGNPDFQRAAADFLVAKCAGSATTAPWTGVQHDEVNASFGWGWNGAVPARYPTDQAWQAALSGHLAHLATRLAGSGATLGGNLGTAMARDEAWYASLVLAGLVPSLEYFVSGERLLSASTENYARTADWERQLGYVEALEGNREGTPAPVTARGTRIVVHDRQVTEDGIRYSLCSYLLATAGTGASVYGADVGYGASDSPYPACYTDALRLGAPDGPRTNVTGDVWGRYFRHGWVLVNAGTTTGTYGGTTLGAHTARIGLTG